ncbi:MAG: rhomboid family intramembrane serine protease [Pseudomonadota bacterium]
MADPTLDDPDTLTPVFRAERRRPCEDAMLVLGSQGIDGRITLLEGNVYEVRVAPARAAEARRELDAYLEENRDYVPRAAVRQPTYLTAWPWFLLYALALWLPAVAAEVTLFATDWYGAGRVHSARILGGEVWRLATALTLHADLQHIVANLGFGFVFGFFAARFLGYGVAALAIFAGGVVGNGLNVLMTGPGHFSIGASTAVFAALGLIGIYSWRMRLYPQQRWPERLGPVIGALALLAYTGTGDENTDIGAHFWGFAAGGGIGYLLAALDGRYRSGATLQRGTALLAGTLLAGAWAVAIATYGVG